MHPDETHLHLVAMHPTVTQMSKINVAILCSLVAVYSVWIITADRRRRALMTQAERDAEDDHMWNGDQRISPDCGTQSNLNALASEESSAMPPPPGD